MMGRRAALALLALIVVPAPALAKPEPAIVRVRLETSAGPITIALEMKRAPITAGNFLLYVEEKRFDGTSFYRAARSRKSDRYGLVQGGVNRVAKRSHIPIPHEPNDRTGIKHVDGTLSMARNAPGTAMGDFFITIGAAPYLDAAPGHPGYAAFGHVVEGMPVVRKILAGKTYPGGWSAQTMGQALVSPVRIIRAKRLP
jgi:peptidyl-prolyl cis-trans isomerase A (cyclophilin A)